MLEKLYKKNLKFTNELRKVYNLSKSSIKKGNDETIFSGKKCLEDRKNNFQEVTKEYYQQLLEKLKLTSVTSKNSFSIMHSHSLIMESIICLAIDMAIEELPILVKVKFQETIAEKSEIKLKIDKIQNNIKLLRSEFRNKKHLYNSRSGTLDYNKLILKNLESDLSKLFTHFNKLVKIGKPINLDRLSNYINNNFIVIARGGFGRSELSFSSDIDVGYCIENTGMEEIYVNVAKEIVIRIETILQDSIVETSHQYFEITSSLKPTLEFNIAQTVTSVLEGRLIYGKKVVLITLKNRLRENISSKNFMKIRIDEFSNLKPPIHGGWNLKYGIGGIRSIQIPLWLIGFLDKTDDFSTIGLINNSMFRKILFSDEVRILIEYLELLNDFRNVIGIFIITKHHDKNNGKTNIKLDTVNIDSKKIYLSRTSRFKNPQDLDYLFNELSTKVQKITNSMFDRIVDSPLKESIF